MFVIFDTEYIADKGKHEEGFDGWKNREITQIAAIKVDDHLNVVDELNIYLRLKLHSHIGKYFVELTGITDEKLSKEGIDFPKAYELFRAFVGDLNCYSHGWTASMSVLGDGEIMFEMMRLYDLKDDNPPKYKNIAPWFCEAYQRRGIDIKKQNSGAIARLLGKEAELEKLGLAEHNAFYDVYSILTGLRFLQFCD